MVFHKCKKKRILSVIITLLLVFTLIPTMAFGADDETVTEQTPASPAQSVQEPTGPIVEPNPINPVVKAEPPEGYTTDANGLLAYRISGSGGIDVIGYVGGKWVGTTYAHRGFFPAVRVDGVCYILFDDEDSLDKLLAEKGIRVTPVVSFTSDGKAIYISYSIENTTDHTVTLDFSIGADLDLAGNDDANLEMMGNSRGFMIMSGPNTDDPTLAVFVTGTSGITDVSTLWLGTYGELDYCENWFAESRDAVVDLDSAFTVSWKNIVLAASQKIVRGVGAAVGDMNATEAIEEEPTNPEPIVYEITNWVGKDFVIDETPEMSVRCAGPFNLYKNVEIDGVVLDSSLVKVSEGSTIAAIEVAYLNKLEPGQHKLVINFTDGGKAEGMFNVTAAAPGAVVKKAPKTGDSESMMIAIGLVLLSGAAVVGLNRKRIKN